MQFKDIDSGTIYTVKDLHRDWATLKDVEPENHCATFKAELFEIILATINSRNDLEIIGMTGKEVSNLVEKLRKQIS